MSTTLKEWLLKTILELEEERDSMPGAVNEDVTMALAAMKLALASLEARSRKLFTCSACGAEGLDEPLESKCHCNEDGAHWIESVVYTAPPAPVADLLLSELLGIAKRAADEADECAHAEFSDDSMEYSAAIADWERRATRLQGADGNPPVIPNGWVACSERMPNIGVPVITCCGDVVQYAAYAWDGKEWQDWYEEYDKLPANTFTHWHPRPAAPQQEVK